MPPVSEVIKGLNEEIKEAERIESQAIIERAEIRKQELSRGFIAEVKRSIKKPQEKETTDIWKNLREKYGVSQNKADLEPKQDRDESLIPKSTVSQNKADLEPKQGRKIEENKEIDDYWDMDR